MTPEHKYWKDTKSRVEKIVSKIQGETGTRFEYFDDLVQECLLKAFKDLDKFESRNGCQKFSFLYSICRNHLINYNIFHTRGCRDYHKLVYAGLTPVNVNDHFGKEDGDYLHYLETADHNNPEDILQSHQLIDAFIDKHQSDKMFQKFVDSSLESTHPRSLETDTAKFIFDGLLERV